MLYISANQAASGCFQGRNSSVAVSVVTSSIGVGGMIFPYVLQHLISSYGLRVALLIVSAITIPLSMLCEPKMYASQAEKCPCTDSAETIHSLESDALSYSASEFDSYNVDSEDFERIDAEPRETHSLSTISNKLKAILFTNTSFVFLLFGLCLALPSQNMFEILLLDILESCRLQRVQSLTLLIVLNCVCILGRFSSGLMVKIPGCGAIMAAILGSEISFFFSILLLLFCGGCRVN